MKNILLLLIICKLITSSASAQNVGIGTTTPNASALLHVDLGTSNTKVLLATGTLDIGLTGSAPNLGAGSRFMYYPGRAAFRAGYVTGSQWDNQNVGFYSTALGQNTIAINSASTAMGSGTTASGLYSTAMGLNTTASLNNSTAMGNSTIAGNDNATAMGRATTANGETSTAMGFATIASGTNSTAMGLSTTASGSNSIAMGDFTTASGLNSTAMGFFTTASGNKSTSMGSNVSTNNQTGAFVIGDSDPNNQGTAAPGLPDLFVARFNNGYYLLTSGYNANIGVQITHNGNSWVSICDVNRKENFAPLDGDDILQKIAKINFTSWNYKQQDPKVYRHYGIMAQDFYQAFGEDKYGTIGNDTTVNPIDMIGIDMAAIQALEKRTTDLKNENAMLNKKLAEVAEVKNEEVKYLKSENENLKKSVAQLQKQFKQQQKLIAKVQSK